MERVTLQLPPGVDGYPVSHGDQSFPYYRPDPNGPFLVDVPPNVAEHLMRQGGFARMPRKDDASVPAMPPGFAMLKAPPDCSGLSFAGQNYTPDQEGIVTIPAHAVGHARAHGFRDPAEAEEALARDAEMAAKDAQIADLKAKLAAALSDGGVEQTKDGGYTLPPSDADRRAKAGS
jgi:hypothetical protein